MTTRPPRDIEATKARILKAAQTIFSEHGYASTGVRDIAVAAQSNAALVNRYFGSKEGLFEAALDDMLDVGLLIDFPRKDFGERLVETFCSQQGTKNPLQLMILSSSDARARAIVDRLLRTRLIEPLKAWLGDENAEERAAHLMLLSQGLFFYRLVYPLDPLTGEFAPATRKWLSQQFQSIVDG